MSFKKSLMSELATVNGFCIQLLDDLRHADRLDIVGRHNETAQSHTCSKRMADATRFLMLKVIAKSKGYCTPDVCLPFQTKPVWIRGAQARPPLTHNHTHARACTLADRQTTDRPTDRLTQAHARAHTHTHIHTHTALLRSASETARLAKLAPIAASCGGSHPAAPLPPAPRAANARSAPCTWSTTGATCTRWYMCSAAAPACAFAHTNVSPALGGQ